MSLRQKARDSYDEARQMEQARRTRKGVTVSDGKNVMIGAVVLMFTLLFILKLAPEINDVINTINLSGLPGGEFVGTTVFLLLMFVLGIVIVIKALDLL